MEAADLPEISGLNPVEQGAVLALALLEAPAAVPRLAGALAQRCAAALAALDGLPREARFAALQRLADRVAAPGTLVSASPVDLAAVLAREPSPLVMAVVSGLPAEVVEAGRALVRARGEDPDAVGPQPVLPAALVELRRAVAALAGS